MTSHPPFTETLYEVIASRPMDKTEICRRMAERLRAMGYKRTYATTGDMLKIRVAEGIRDLGDRVEKYQDGERVMWRARK